MGRRTVGSFVGRLLLCVVGCLVFLTNAAPEAEASASIKDEFLFRMGMAGSQAGGLFFGKGIVTSPSTGLVYVAGEGTNKRVAVFTPWGEFVSAFGWDVAPGAVNEVQEVRVRATDGAFVLSYGGDETPELPFNASGAEVELALNALPSIGGAGAEVDVTGSPGLEDGSIPFVYAVVFKGSLGGTNVPAIGASEGSPPLAEGILEVRTRADGTPGGSGLESCTSESGCQAGVAGDGKGQLKNANGAAIDAEGNVYVQDRQNHRIQKFDSAGRFVWMVGGEVNRTKVEESAAEAQRNLCPIDPGDECQAGTEGSGSGQFEANFGLTLSADGRLYAGDVERVQIFSEDGEYVEDLPDPEGSFSGKTVLYIAVDSVTGRLYCDLLGEDGVLAIDAESGAQVSAPLPVAGPTSLSVDPEGHVFVVSGAKVQRPYHVEEYDLDGSRILPDDAEETACQELEEGGIGQCDLFAAPEAGLELRGIGSSSTVGDLYVANVQSGGEDFIEVWGPPPLHFESPPPAPPSIEGQFAAEVTDTEAKLRAEINPHFFSGALGETTYFLQYAAVGCVGEGGWEAECVDDEPAAPGRVLDAGIVSTAVKTPSITLSGLSPGSSYVYRFVAEGSGEPGVQVEGGEASFTTYRQAGPEPCPNDEFRPGGAEALPDCRAYEMVSPMDKEGGEVRVLTETLTSLPAVLGQSADSGDKVAYGSYKSFGDAESAPYTTQYIGERGATGWSNHAVSPPRTRPIVGPLGASDTEFRQFSGDLCEGWLQTYADPPLTESAVAGYPNLYLRVDGGSGCGGKSYEALTTVEPPVRPGESFDLELQGVSADGLTTVYVANDKLTENAPSGSAPTLYVRRGETLRYLCILPGGAAASGGCSAGGRSGKALRRDRLVRLDDALSGDGERVYWSNADDSIYLRENPFGSGSECVGESAPCTREVSGSGAQFWGASEDGSVAIYERAGGLYEFRREGEESAEIAGEAEGVMGMSSDASHLYFASREDLDGGGPAEAGGHNLYLRIGGEEGESTRFVAALDKEDVDPASAVATSATAAEPWLRASRVSPDGEAAAFMSFSSLTGYDNREIESGKPAAEVYLYDASAEGGAGELICASCNPSGKRPRARNVGLEGSTYLAAARIPVASDNLRESNILAAGGKRLYFESFDSLALTDTNGVGDVYQWEALGTGHCSLDRASYIGPVAGCVDLISSGQSEVDSTFVDASPDGQDIFFITLSDLVEGDPGLLDVYDARVEGGLPAPAPEPPECEGEECQSPAPAPSPIVPFSDTYTGPGNLSPPKAKKRSRRCPKGKHKVRRKGKVRCVKNKKVKSRRHVRHRHRRPRR